MENADPASDLAPAPGAATPVGDLVGPAVCRSLSALAFWASIAMPAVYLPLLAAGIDTADGLGTFLLLFALHVVALVGGRRHRRPAERRSP